MMMNRVEIPVPRYATSGEIRAVGERIEFLSASPIHGTAALWGRQFKVHDGAPPSIEAYEGAYYVPGARCLYDADGRRIEQSCLRRGPRLEELVEAGAPRIVPPKDARRVDDPILYLSHLSDHWGHLLTEGLSRVWPRLLHPDLAALRGFFDVGGTIGRNVLDVLDALGLRLGDTVLTATTPVRFDKIFVPQASFSNRGEAFAVHRDVAARVARAHLADAPAEDRRPVFLSRFGVRTQRPIGRQRRLERLFAANGCRVVHPETMSLREQITLFNTHRHFIGCWGSAFHTALFCLRPEDRHLHVACHAIPHVNFLMFDALLGNRATYVSCVRIRQRPWPLTKLAVDPDVLDAYYRNLVF